MNKNKALVKKNQKENVTKATNPKRDLMIDWIIFAGLMLSVSAVLLVLFYNQCVCSMQGIGSYYSDMRAYILEMQGLESGYSFPYPILFKLAAFFHLFAGPELAMALAVLLLNVLAMVVTKLAFNRWYANRAGNWFTGCRWIWRVWLSLAAVSLFFVSMVYPPTGLYLPGIRYNYLGVFTPNPFHNATYMAARPFAILTFLWFGKLLDSYEETNPQKAPKFRDYALFSLFLLLATMTKPSFTIVLVGAAGLLMLFRLFVKKFRNLRQTILLGLTFLPTFADLLYQFKGVFVPTEGNEGGIGFGFGRVWTLYCDNIPLAIGLAAGFPILVLLLNWREWKKNTLYRFSWLLYLMSLVMAFFLYEKGFREPDFNFSWGYMCGIFFVFFSSMTVLIKETAAKRRPVLLMLQWLAYLWHLTCGLYYFYGICQGRMYY